ncbi:Demethylsterigmatocystin 6-O-methyltransferase [Madurella mycetomatis]|uniref:Demethylsterigmatocystin 6-O-methyltransferase n=1 Tax=Madurella mycetomatis TaxID=100816 RepID=A0A175WDJ2_9PEZI|nr:Demethylsterigmatocystin 6-O-methyltransferase [Madurella mycetomatis]
MVNSVAIEKTEKLLQELRAEDGTPSNKAALIRRLEEVRTSLQEPPDIANFYIKKGLVLIIINTCVELGVFDAVPLDAPASAEEISAKVGVDASILSRFLRALTVEGFFAIASTASRSTFAPAQHVYTHTPASLSLRGPPAHAWWRAALTLPMNRLWRAPDYLRSHTAAETRDPRRNGLTWAMGLEEEGLTFFEALERDEHAGFWKSSMERAEYGRGTFPWAALWREVLQEEDSQGRVFVVDVGGGRGRALMEIIRECGGENAEPFHGKMVLEDLEFVLEGEKPVRVEGVKNVVYDFFAEKAEQPVKNAHVYHLCRVLHDYYDDRARHILRQVVDAMNPASRVVLCEYIMPEDTDLGDEIFPYLMDFLLFMSGGLERTEAQWRQLLDSVGLEIVHIWRSNHNPIEADIEAQLKGSNKPSLDT